MDELKAIEQRVAGEMLRRAGPSLPVDDLAVYEAVAGATRAPWRSFGSAFTATKVAIAASIVALLGGLALAGVLMQPSEERVPAVGASATPRASAGDGFDLPTELPDDIRSGTIDTPAGQARWVHLTAGTHTLPGPGELIPWSSGLALFEEPRPDWAASYVSPELTGPARLWLSPDGIDWQAAELPLPPDAQAASLSYVDGAYWLVSSVEPGSPEVRASRIWSSADGSEWHEIDTRALPPVGPLGFGFDSSHAHPASSGDRTLIGIGYHALLPMSFQAPEDFVPGCYDDPGPFPLVDDVGYLCRQPAMRFVETGEGVRVLDYDSGAEVRFIAGAGLDDLAKLDSDPSAFEEWSGRLLLIEGGQALMVEPPWSPANQVVLLGNDDGFYAISQEWTVNGARTHTWRSDDGVSWRAVPAPAFMDDGSAYDFWGVSSGHIVAYGADEQAWETFDGVDWVPAPGDRPACDTDSCGERESMVIGRLGSGWFAADPGLEAGDGDTLWVHAGDRWISLADLGMEVGDERPDSDLIHKTGIEDTTIFRPDTSDQREIWILDFETPADQ